MVALVATVLLGWYGLLRHRFGGWTLAFGGLAWMALFGVLFAALVPGGSYLVALPALAGAVAGTVALLVPRPGLRLLAVTVAAAVAVLILAPTVQMFFPALGMETAGATAFFAILLGLALLPVLEYVYPPRPSIPAQKSSSTVESLDPSSTVEKRRVVVVSGHRPWAATPAVLAFVLTLVFVGVGLAVDRFDAAHPTRTQLMYALDTDTGQARWLSGEARPSAWTSQYVTGVEDMHDAFPILATATRPELNTGPAQAAPLTAPNLTVVADTTVDGRRALNLSIEPRRPVRLVYFAVETDAKVVKAIVAGREVSVDPGAVFALLFHAPPPGGLSVRLTLDGTAPVKVRVMDGSDGLDNLPGFQPRPPGIGVVGSHDSELVVVARTYPL